LLRTKSLLNRRVSEQAIAKELRVPFFVARKLKEQCGNFSSEKLEEIYRLLAEADLALKTGARTPRLLLEDLLTKIMR
jgi:DNA polymerase-3 subunit delta